MSWSLGLRHPFYPVLRKGAMSASGTRWCNPQAPAALVPQRAGGQGPPRSPLAPEARSAAGARSSTRSSLGPDGDENERICQIVCHELSLLALGLSYSQALKWWKLPKDVDFLSTWASPEKKIYLSFFKQISPLTSTCGLRGPRNFLTGRPDGC